MVIREYPVGAYDSEEISVEAAAMEDGEVID